MFDDIFKNVNSIDDWDSLINKRGVSFNSPRDELIGYSNVDVDNFMQNIMSNNPNFSGADIDHIRQSIAGQKQNATDLLTGIQDAIELKGVNLGKNINITPSSMHENLRFASVVGPSESVIAGLGLNTDQVNNIVMNTANQVYSDLGLQNIPTRVNINYGTGVRVESNGSVTLGSRSGVGDINVNFDNIISNMASKGIASPEEAARAVTDTVAHEMRHQWQQHYDNAAYRQDVEGYIDAAVDFSGYYEQAIEKDARAYGQDFADRYAKQYYDQAMEQFPRESFVPHYQEEVVASKGFFGRVKDKISGFFGGGSQSSTLESGAPILENAVGGESKNIGDMFRGFTDTWDMDAEVALNGIDKVEKNIRFGNRTFELNGERYLADFSADGIAQDGVRFTLYPTSKDGDVLELGDFFGKNSDIEEAALNFGNFLQDLNIKVGSPRTEADKAGYKEFAEAMRAKGGAYQPISDAEGLAKKGVFINPEKYTGGNKTDYTPQRGDNFLRGGERYVYDEFVPANPAKGIEATHKYYSATSGQTMEAQIHDGFKVGSDVSIDTAKRYKQASSDIIDAHDEYMRLKREGATPQQMGEFYERWYDPAKEALESVQKQIKAATKHDTELNRTAKVRMDSLDSNRAYYEDHIKTKKPKPKKESEPKASGGGGGGKKPPEKKPTATPEPPERGGKKGGANKKGAPKKERKTVETKPKGEKGKTGSKSQSNNTNKKATQAKAKQTPAGPNVSTKLEKGTGKLRSADGRTVKGTSKNYGINVTESTNPKMKYDISGGHKRMNLDLKGAIDKNGNLAFLNVHDKNVNDVYNLLGNGSKKTGAASSKQWKDYVDYANSYDVDLPRWATHNYRQRRRSAETYDSEKISKTLQDIGHDKEIPDYVEKVFKQNDPDTTSEGPGPETTTKPEPESGATENGPQGQDYDIYTEEGQRRLADEKIEALEEKYNNGDLTDDEYIEELNKIHQDHLTQNPLDDSNVLNKPKGTPEGDPTVTPESIYEDFLNNKQVPLSDEMKESLTMEKMTNNIDNSNINVDNADTSQMDESLNKMLEEERRLRENRIFEKEEYDRIEQQIIDKFNDGDITQEEMRDMMEELDKRYKPLTQQEVQDYIDAASDPAVREPGNPFHADLDNRKSTIEKHFKGDDYEGNIKNGFVQDIKVGDDEYTVKTRTDDGTIDIFDSNGNVVVDPAITKEVNAKVFDETNNFYSNLTDDEWDTVIKNAEDYRFDGHTATDTLTKREASMLNMNDAIDKRQEVLKAQREAVKNDLETAKGKKKKKKLTDQRNHLDIKKLEAEKLKYKNQQLLDASGKRKAARAKFNKTLGLDAFEAGSDEFKQALEALKGTEEYTNAMDVFKKELKQIDQLKRNAIKSNNKILDSQIKGLQGKGLTVGNVMAIGSAAIGAVNKYKESRAEGKGVVSSTIRAGAAAAAAELMGPTASVIAMGARVAGNAAVEFGDQLYKENRRMNSASNFTPLGGVNFQDSQELATMRQSGMELAKMSQYNLEQTLMGAEAKHLHR